MRLETAIFVGGILHFGTLLAGAAVPRVLDWKNSLKKLQPLSRQVIWVHGLFIVLVIVSFGLLSTGLSHELAGGTRLARAICGFIGFFWGTRLLMQFFVFDARPFLSNLFLKIGYHGLTFVFMYHALVYSYAAFRTG